MDSCYLHNIKFAGLLAFEWKPQTITYLIRVQAAQRFHFCFAHPKF